MLLGPVGSIQSCFHIPATLPWLGKGSLEAGCDLPGIPAPSGQQPQGSLSFAVFPELGHATAVREHLLAMAVVQGEAPALPLTSTSTERGQASCVCTNRN